MKRTLPWAIVAFYPLIALAAASLLGGKIDAYFAGQATVSSLGELVASYWWTFLVATVIFVIAFFLASVLRNSVLPASRRVLWAAAIVFLGPLAVPAYWWRHVERGGA